MQGWKRNSSPCRLENDRYDCGSPRLSPPDSVPRRSRYTPLKIGRRLGSSAQDRLRRSLYDTSRVCRVHEMVYNLPDGVRGCGQEDVAYPLLSCRILG